MDNSITIHELIEKIRKFQIDSISLENQDEVKEKLFEMHEWLAPIINNMKPQKEEKEKEK